MEERTWSDDVAVTVSVTDEHIERGIRNSARRCPVALALADALRLPTPPAILKDRIEVRGVRYRLTERARRAIRRYDRGGEMRPFCLTVWLRPESRA